jgi:hypothetical protein
VFSLSVQLDGTVRISGNEATSPHIEVLNGSSKAIRYFEIGWTVKYGHGKEFWARAVEGRRLLISESCDCNAACRIERGKGPLSRCSTR